MKPFLGPAQRKVLWAILCAAQDGRSLKVRQICQLLGANSPNAAHDLIKKLQRKGLVTWIPGSFGTLRPLVRVEFWMEEK